MIWRDTVDGRNPAPVEVGSLSQYLPDFIHAKWLAGFLPSTVCGQNLEMISQTTNLISKIDFQIWISCGWPSRPSKVHDDHFAHAAHGQALSLDEARWLTILDPGWSSNFRVP